MNTAAYVDALIKELEEQKLSKAERVVRIARACLGWAYVWGSYGQYCTTSVRKSYMRSSNIAEGDINLIKKNCQILSGKKSTCDGCKYYPENQQTRVFDCRGFTQWVLKRVGISLAGGGATSQWNSASNWTEKGTIDTLPKDKVCCIFRRVGNKMEHTLLYDGNGHYIHCSGEVKEQDISKYKATHWAIPKGLYTEAINPTPTPVEKGTAVVTGKSVALRVGPTTSAGIRLRIATNQKVKITTPPDNWSYVEWNGKKGYMMNQYLNIDKINKVAKVTGKKLALRHGPTTDAAVVTRVNTGEQVKLIEPPTDWLYVTYNNKSGYMMREFLREG